MAKINFGFLNDHNEKADESQGKRLINIMTEAYKNELITKEELEKEITKINELWGEQNEKLNQNIS